MDFNGAHSRAIERELKRIDKRFRIGFNYADEKYYIYFKDELFQTVPYGEVTRALIEDIGHTMWLNKQGTITEYVDGQNEKLEASKDREITNMAEALAKDIRRPLINNYYYGE
jgi:hypothetical protein